MHPFRFGVQMSEATSGAEWAEKARRIEGNGFSTLFMPDHFDDTMLAPMPAIAMAAAATQTLRVGTLVLGNDYKHPAVVAKEAATIDLLSDGRLELGIGAGWMIADYEEIGWEYDRPGVRIERLEEAVVVIKGAWAPGAFSFAGEHYTITDYDATPEPAQKPHPPLLIGGGGSACCRSRRERPTSSASTRTWLREPPLRRSPRPRWRRRPPTRSVGSRRRQATASTTSSSRCATSSPPSPTTVSVSRR
ncbi:MAG: LLM class flavin-dependent oxidoreductase [Acidimicrobiia bacterium]|nr:LLM class flavin-dependent oxidoreductase [Acidimicrobiia bacterium]